MSKTRKDLEEEVLALKRELRKSVVERKLQYFERKVQYYNRKLKKFQKPADIVKSTKEKK